MNRFRISQQAHQDLEDIWVYLAQQDEFLADKQIAQTLDRFPMLSQFSSLGRQRDDLLVGLRNFPINPYIIFIAKLLMVLKLLEFCTNRETLTASFRDVISESIL